MNEWLLIALMAAITYGIRYLLLASASSWKLPKNLERSLSYVPVAVLSAIVVQTILKPGDSAEALTVHWPFLLSAIVAFLVARLSNSLMITVVAGLCFYWAFLSFAPQGLAS